MAVTAHKVFDIRMPLVLKVHTQSVFLALKHLFNSEAIYATHIFACLHGAAAGSLEGGLR